MAHLSTRDFNFQGNAIRCIGTNHNIWFVAKDVCAALGIAWKGATESLASIPREWIGVRKLRTPIQHRDGATRSMDNSLTVINEFAVYRLVFRSNQETALAFTNWVAGEVLPEIGTTGSYRGKRRSRYERDGKALGWIDQREDGIETRKKFTDSLKDHEVKDDGFAACTNAIYEPVLGGPAHVVKSKMGLAKRASLRDNLSAVQLAAINLTEQLSLSRIEHDGIKGNGSCAQACCVSAQAVADALIQAESAPLNATIPMPRPKRLRPRAARIEVKAA